MGKVSNRKADLTGPGEPSPSPEVNELIRRLASFPRGVAFLDTGALECVAIVFGVCPDVILEVRGYLASHPTREWFLDQVRQAHSDHPEPWHAPRPQLGSLTPGPRTAAALARAADTHEYGISFLLESPPETVAVVFHVHPQLVLRARAVFTRWSARKRSKPNS